MAQRGWPRGRRLAIACSAGGYRTVFIQGVLAALEDAGIRAAAYGASSASVTSAALAAGGDARAASLAYAQESLRQKERFQRSMAEVNRAIIHDWLPRVRELLFREGSPRFLLPVSMVVSEKAAVQTQGRGARRLGRRLLLAAGRGDDRWAKANLKLRLYDTDAGARHRLTATNFAEIAYASTRMLHAWDEPGWAEGQAAVDASYTCVCPARELVELGYPVVLALAWCRGRSTPIFSARRSSRNVGQARASTSCDPRPIRWNGGRFQRSERGGAGAPLCGGRNARPGMGGGVVG
ncbi:MAG: hypothetical protein OXG09_02325 [Chloroflexi bacterium]|nr:hypothetical protein [Chloroflexota bacterium]